MATKPKLQRLPYADWPEHPRKSPWVHEDPAQDLNVAKLVLIGLISGCALVGLWKLMLAAMCC